MIIESALRSKVTIALDENLLALKPSLESYGSELLMARSSSLTLSKDD